MIAEMREKNLFFSFLFFSFLFTLLCSWVWCACSTSLVAQNNKHLFFPSFQTQAHLVVQLSLACMLHLLSCTVQLLVLGSDLIAARLVVLAQASIVCLQAPDFRLQAGNLSRELGVLQRPLAIGWSCPNTATALRPLQHCVAALALVPE